MIDAIDRTTSAVPDVQTVVVVGLGNIGAYIPHYLAQMPGVRRIVLIDPDRYELRNLHGQAITRHDVGVAKVRAQARRARSINRAVEIVPFELPVESVPLGHLRAAAILGAVDSLETRQYLNQCAFQLGVIYLDGGVNADDMLARVTVLVPGRDRACLECGFTDEMYERLGQTYPCQHDAPATGAAARTNAPPYLGGLVAAMLVAELQKVLDGAEAELLAGREILVHARSHRHVVTELRRSPTCRFDHQRRPIVTLARSAGEITLEEAFALGATADDDPADAAWLGTLRLEGRRFCRRLVCPHAHERHFVHLTSSLRDRQRRCKECPRPVLMTVPPGDLVDELEPGTVEPHVRTLTLGALGLRRADVFAIRRAHGETYYQIGG